MKPIFLLVFFLQCLYAVAQLPVSLADSIRIQYKIPELGYAVVSADSVLDLQVLGIKKQGTQIKAELNDRFRIGSNTKGITGFIAAELVKQQKISWDTKFFDLFPELKSGSKADYYNVTLLDLLSFRAKLFAYTYTNEKPSRNFFKGSATQQQYQFAHWFFKQKPVEGADGYSFSNLGYVAAGLMLEKASGLSYRQLVNNLGTQLGISFEFGSPNSADSLQPWGHNALLQPEPPGDNYKLTLLDVAGNINVSLPDYVKFIQLQLSGLHGLSGLLSKNEFEFLHYGLGRFSVGWFWAKAENGDRYSYNTGNPGTFLSKVYIYPDKNLAYVVLVNVQSPQAEEGINKLLDELKTLYNK